MKELILLEHFINSQRISNAERLEAIGWLSKVAVEIQDAGKRLNELEQRLEALKNADKS